MGKKIRLTESQFNSVIKFRLLSESPIKPINPKLDTLPGSKGRWKDEWNEDDQILGMFNSLYGIEELGISKRDAAEKIIGTSEGSFAKQTSNFDYLRTGEGLDRPHELQSKLYNELKDKSREELKRIALDILIKREQNPETAVTRKQTGAAIGNKRDEISTSRDEGLRKLGKDPSKYKLIRSAPKVSEPSDDELDIPDELGTPMNTTPNPKKEDMKRFLNDLLNNMRGAESIEDVQKLSGDVEFIRDYLDSEWLDGEDEQMVAEVKTLYYKKTIPEITRIKTVMGL